jgi:hypothetical protein
VGVLPILKLFRRHPESDGFLDAINLDFLEHDIRPAGSKLSGWVTHRRRAIAAAAGLVKHQRSVSLG